MPEPIRVVVPGPLHPDLFGGETPVEEVVELDGDKYVCFRVLIAFMEPQTTTVEVVATSAEEAGSLALEKAVMDEDGLDFEVQDVTAIRHADTAAIQDLYIATGMHP